MSDRISKRDVDAALLSASRAARDAGLNTEGWILHHGSSSNGINWTLETGRGGSANVSVGSFNSLGQTAKEAWRTLRTLEAAWRAVAAARETGFGWKGDAK